MRMGWVYEWMRGLGSAGMVFVDMEEPTTEELETDSESFESSFACRCFSQVMTFATYLSFSNCRALLALSSKTCTCTKMSISLVIKEKAGALRTTSGMTKSFKVHMHSHLPECDQCSRYKCSMWRFLLEPEVLRLGQQYHTHLREN